MSLLLVCLGLVLSVVLLVGCVMACHQRSHEMEALQRQQRNLVAYLHESVEAAMGAKRAMKKMDKETDR